MRMTRSVDSMQRVAGVWRRAGQTVALVPTMGCLHEGHLSLVRRARRTVGTGGKVVLSIYVNPTQFAANEDFSRYPRDLKRDLSICQHAGVDVVFAPSDSDMYPQPFSTFVVEESLSRSLEGASRPTHFRGVTTVVAKVFNIVQPEVAIFGAKDYQQAAIIKRMVQDLNFPVRVLVAPTFREPDGLAMSSRNKYLVGALRSQAVVLFRAICAARDEVRTSRKPITAESLQRAVTSIVTSQPDAKLDYVEFFEPKTLEPVAEVTPGTHMALAVFVGPTRLIDNAQL